MKQAIQHTMTGPFGMMAYHTGSKPSAVNYPEINTPCCAFARFGGFADNSNHAPTGIRMVRRAGSALALVK